MSTSSPVDESRMYGLIRRRLLPWLFLGYVLCFLDRTILGMAALRMNTDIGISVGAYGLGAGLFFLAYVLFEPPSNLIMARVGARIWISRIMVSWGLITFLTAFVWDEQSFFVARVALGIAEAGFFPAIIYYVALWFPPPMRARAVAAMALAIPVSNVVGAPLAGWVLGSDGALAGWQWLFVLLGGVTVAGGVIVYFMLPSGPEHVSWLTPEQRSIVSSRADFTRSTHSIRIQLRGMAVLARSPQLWLLTVVYMLVGTIGYAVTFFLPTVVAETSTAGLGAVGLGVAGVWVVATVLTYLNGRLADRFKRDWPFVLVAIVVHTIGLALFVPASTSPVLLTFCAGASAAVLGMMLGPLWSVITRLLGPAHQTAGAIAVINALSGVGGFLGPYALGWVLEANGGDWRVGPPAAAIAMAAAGVVVMVLWALDARSTQERPGVVSGSGAPAMEQPTWATGTTRRSD